MSSYLCKPEGTVFDYYDLQADDSPLWEYDEDTKKDVEDILPTVMEWVKKLNHLSYGTDFDYNVIDVNSDAYLELLEQVLDVDEVVRYFAVHSWLCQLDNMFVGRKNFGLYVNQEGKALIVPWDYDLSFGCYFPSTAELTANYPIDVMFRLSEADRADADEIAAETYAGFPLFHVIYQNDVLMERYHGYMKDCSKIVALGGTAEANGKTYEPGYFNSVLEVLKAEVIAAATEKTASNVYYMNNIKQPRDVRAALPNLAKILAMRSVGVYTQVEKLKTTVCGQGCDLSRLGNGVAAEGSVKGNLTIVDEKTGIFVSGQYTGDRRSGSPMLTVTAKTGQDALSTGNIGTVLNLGQDAELVSYAFAMTKKATGGYTVTIPLTQEYFAAKDTLKVYAVTNEAGVAELSGVWEDNLFTAEVADLQYIVLVRKPGTGDLTEKTPDLDTEDEENIGNRTENAGDTEFDDTADMASEANKGTVILCILGGVLCVAGGIVVIMLARKRRKQK